MAAAGKVLRDSEYGDGDGSGAGLAASLLADFAALHPRGWCYWQAVDVADGWGFFSGDADSARLTAVNSKLYVVAQFSRHIREGMTIMATNDARDAAVAAHDSARALLVLVTANAGGEALDAQISLAAFTTAPAAPALPAWVTSTASAAPNATAAHSPLAGAALGADKVLRLRLPPHSVVTVEVPGVVV